MNKKRQELFDLIANLEGKLVILSLIRKIIKVSYMILSVSTITTMIIGLIYDVSNIYSFAFWLLFLVFVLFFVEKLIISIEPSFQKNLKFLKEYASNFEIETDKAPSKSKK